MSLVLVTLAYNNAEEARKTLASVAMQTVIPSRYLVVDSSGNHQAQLLQRYASQAKAEYFWVRAGGVYSAMNEALTLVDDEDFVWFINSSDWLSGPHSVEIAREGLFTGAHWVVGGLSRLGDRRTPFHQIPVSGDELLRLIRSGATGFPHPSSVMQKQLIADSGGFDPTLRIAADYKLALKYAELVGPPLVIPETLAVHVPEGLTSRHRVRHAWEKARSRRQMTEPTSLGVEASILLRTAVTRMGFTPQKSWGTVPFPVTNPFGDELDQWKWPE